MHDELAACALALAQRFAAGATMWCVAPGADHHARHLAVEFVHPVVVGARSLPAVAIGADDPLTAARTGDVLFVLGAADAAMVDRATAHGLVLMQLDARGDELFDGTLVRAYHVLWELTHVCFEHPGLVA
ncbi:MAG TPA: hypothetical protein VHC63_08485 [Acidimicrobiales bacterium]|nr:hypothetical protein [Acidimicrobiales bacterium]